MLSTLFLLAGAFLVFEMRTSWLQARLFSHMARGLSYELQQGPSEHIRFPEHGPYDERLGYTRLPEMLDRLQAQSFDIVAQVRVSESFEEAVDRGLFPLYREKNQAGLQIFDQHEALLFQGRYPVRVYDSFEAIPPLVWQTLLYIENRELLDPRFPNRNPAVEWDRFTMALFDQGLQALGFDRDGPGASTLATQLEKFRHSPGGRTATQREKLRQMTDASLRSYLDGENTLEAQHLIIRDYLNTVPLAAIAGYGEIIGLGDGLWAWYGVDFEDVNRLLWEATELEAHDDPTAHATAFREVLSLYLANRRPSFFLLQPEGRAALEQVTDEYIELLAAEGLLSPLLRDAALTARPALQDHVPAPPPAPFVSRKAPNAVRTELMGRLGAAQLYELDHFDLTVHTTFDRGAQQAIATLLQQLKDPDYIRDQRLIGARLLGQADPANVSYAVVLYEATPQGNLVRVQADNFEGPFNINEGSKLELGSTAKLRTLVHYLQIVEALHVRYASLSPDSLRAVKVHRADRLTAWAVDYLARSPDGSLSAMLEAAMERRYSASPGEQFFTGGGAHVFHNFAGAYSGSVLSVHEGFRQSVNLVFIRLMRDIVHYYLYRLPGNPAAMLDDPQDPRRQVYLARFADQEGRLFLNQFYQRYTGQPESEIWAAFRQAHRLSPQRLAWAFRSTNPEAGPEALAELIRGQVPGARLSEQGIAALYAKTDPRAFSWQDRGYLAGVHPLELWLLHYLRQHPQANWDEVVAASAAVRQEVYGWLFKSTDKRAHDRRIGTLLEEEAFAEIHKAWKQTGYPFDRLVPSYATAIGSSADRPDALAELVGLIMRDGVRYPALRVEALHFGAGTPYETILRSAPPVPERVLSSDVAATVRAALIDVVEHGTARRAFRAIEGPGGTPLVIGGKTGTGDNRMKIYGSGGQMVGAETLNRTSTFVFFLGDRFFGTITVFVSGPQASRYAFTSSLPAQLLKMLEPVLAPWFETAEPQHKPAGMSSELAASQAAH